MGKIEISSFFLVFKSRYVQQGFSEEVRQWWMRRRNSAPFSIRWHEQTKNLAEGKAHAREMNCRVRYRGLRSWSLTGTAGCEENLDIPVCSPVVFCLFLKLIPGYLNEKNEEIFFRLKVQRARFNLIRYIRRPEVIGVSFGKGAEPKRSWSLVADTYEGPSHFFIRSQYCWTLTVVWQWQL